MNHYHACVWIDHQQAKVFGIGADDAEVADIKSDAPHHHIHAKADPQENRLRSTNELYLSGRHRLARNWDGKAQLRHDFAAGRAVEAALGLEFRNECLAVDLSLGRRFTSSSTLRPSTDFGFKLALLGFGGGGAAGAARQCR